MAPLRWVLYETATGTAIAYCLAPPTPVPDGAAVYEVPAEALLNVTHAWDPATRTVIAKPPVTSPVLGKGAFMRRLGFTREVLLRVVMLDPSTALELRAQLQTLDAWLARAVDVDVEDPITVSGVALMGHVLDAQGALPEGKTAFTTAMLAPVLVEAGGE